MAHLFRVVVPVRDMASAAKFYGQVLGTPGQSVTPGRWYFNCEGTILACFDPRADGDGYDAQPLPEPIYFAVDDLEATYANATAAGGVFSADVVPGVGPLGQIAKRPWGERSFYVADPFGNRLCFVSRDSIFTV